MSEDKISELISKYFDGFRVGFDESIFHEDYCFTGPVIDDLKGSRDKKAFLQEMKQFSELYPLDKNKGKTGITVLAQGYDDDKNQVLAFYTMHFANGFELDVGDLLQIKDNKIIHATAVFDPRMFLEA